uniref:Uncharacterized protein n=1 Tax=Arundo donax TaxID=35708 RepID=A0A0A8YY30_ARUDO
MLANEPLAGSFPKSDVKLYSQLCKKTTQEQRQERREPCC